MSMTIKRIVITTEESQRVVLYPEGGMQVEVNVDGIGWTLDDANHDEIYDLLFRAYVVVGKAAAPELLEALTLALGTVVRLARTQAEIDSIQGTISVVSAVIRKAQGD